MKIKFGILSTATIAVEDVIPAMLESKYCELVGIASRSAEKAKAVANQFRILKYYGSYQSLLDDTEIEAVYIPLPNHLHVKWAIKALKAGKHVLVEKPIALTSAEARLLVDESKKHPELKIMEAFMYKHHPQWIKVKEMIENGAIGTLKVIQSSFSFFEDDRGSIVNNKAYGGGSLMDVGCYPISVARFLFGEEPKNVVSNIEYHPEFGIDTIASGILEFEQGYCTFFSSIRLADDQCVRIFGTKGIIEFEMPFNPATDVPTKVFLIKEEQKKAIEFDICNQYVLQVDVFALAIIEDKEVPTGLEDAVGNMMVIEELRNVNNLSDQS